MGRHKKEAVKLELPLGLSIAERPSHVELLSRRRSKWAQHALAVLSMTGTQAVQIDMSNVPDVKKTCTAIRAGVAKELRDVHKVTKMLKWGFDNSKHILYLWIN